MKNPVVFLLLLTAAAPAMTVEELALAPEGPGWAAEVQEVGLIELVAGLERIADDETLTAVQRLERLGRFAGLEVGVDALLQLSGDGLPILALSEGLPENLGTLLRFY
ncbi:MAG TPA: hypothetical protein ENN88_04320, partial [Candidatus Coatesbacteria bacterium]|nr:hypothetical protein [Candidatus Coatesbacteria bacterium]